jgi:dihydroorotase
MTINPAKLYKFNAGSISVGKPADIVLFDENKQWEVKEFVSKASNSPFIGMTLTGKVIKTICGGKIVYELGK